MSLFTRSCCRNPMIVQSHNSNAQCGLLASVAIVDSFRRTEGHQASACPTAGTPTWYVPEIFLLSLLPTVKATRAPSTTLPSCGNGSRGPK